MSTDIEVKEQELNQEVAPVLSHAQALQIRNNEEYTEGAEVLKAIKTARARVAGEYDDLIAEAFKHHKNLIAKKGKWDLPLLQAEGLIKKKMGDFITEQERKTHEEQMRLQEIARKQEEARRLQEAAELEMDGRQAEGEALLEIVPEPVHVVLPPPVAKVQGISSRETWSATVVDLMALVKAVAAGQVPITALKANEVFLNNQARALRDLLKYPGVKVTSTKTIAAGTR